MEKQDKYQENGYTDRADYFGDLSRSYGVDISIVYDLAEILGDDEEFDQLPITLHDMTDTCFDWYTGRYVPRNSLMF